jgi:hypothetical protein
LAKASIELRIGVLEFFLSINSEGDVWFHPVVFGTKVEEVGMVYFSRCGAMYERHSSK